MKWKKILIFLLLGIFLINFVCPIQTVIENNLNFENGYTIVASGRIYIHQGQSYTINFFVYNRSNGATINNSLVNCTFYMTNSTGDLINSNKTNYNEYWFYQIDSSNFSQMGEYNYGISCIHHTKIYGGAYVGEFEVTKLGKEFTQEQSILYLIIVGVLILLLVFFIYGAIAIPFRNLRSNEEFIIGINYLKYAKLFCIYFSYLLFVWIMNLLVGLTNYYLDLGLALPIFSFIFRFLSRTLFPVFILTFAYVILLIIKDKKIKRALERGITLK